MAKTKQVVQGVAIDRRSQVHVDPELNDLLFDVAVALQDDKYAVDVQHVVAALVMASRSGEIEPQTTLQLVFDQQRDVLSKYVRVIFEQYQGRVGEDD